MTINCGKSLVSVVIPNYNYAHYMSDCINSILTQSYPNIEVIFVDDGSTDDSVLIAKSFSERVKVIVQDHKGVNAARNLGISHAIGKYIAFCDSDDVWLPDKIERQLDYLEKNPAVGLVYSGISLVDENLQLIRNQEGRYSGDCSRDFLLHPSQAIVLLGASTALIRKEIVTLIGNFDETLSGPGEDWDFFRRISQNTFIDFIDKYLVLYRQHTKSASRVSVEKYFEGNRRAVRNMYRQSDHNFLERRYSWMVLHWSFFKTELKSKRFSPAVRQIAKALSPIGR